MADDTIRKDAPAARDELAVLQALSMGETRISTLFPVLGESIEWRLIQSHLKAPQRWVFEGSFCDVPFITVVVTEEAEVLTITVAGKDA